MFYLKNKIYLFFWLKKTIQSACSSRFCQATVANFSQNKGYKFITQSDYVWLCLIILSLIMSRP